jgi:hypothetical protein
LEPSGLVINRGVSVGAATAVSISIGSIGICPFPLGFGESIKVSNTGTASCVLWYTYYDIPDTNLTLVRELLHDTTPVVIVPAADSGYFRRTLRVRKGGGLSSPRLEQSGGVQMTNDDTASAIVTAKKGSAIMGRVVVTSGSATFNTQLNPDLRVTNEDATLELAGTVSTRDVSIFGCYETLPLE